MAECPEVEELERFLDAGADDPELASHLESCARCREAVERVRRNNELFAELAGSGTAELAAEVGYAGSAAAAGYRILEELHRGGQGVVYRALQESTRRTVALKVLLEGALASEEKRRRFEREIEVVAGLRHPGIVTVFDSGQLEDGRHFFAMEYIEGETLDVFTLLRYSEGWTTEDALRLFARICQAVQYAHQRGVMHRDLKPSNILVDEAGAPQVLDFGLAKAIDSDVAEAAALTLTHEFMGTLAYASPEQLKGDPSLVDLRTDVYSLGVILYELLTGHSPYPASDRMADLVFAIAETEPKPPSSVTGKRTGLLARPARHPRRVGGELDTIVLKALAKEPGRRYQSAGELGREVERYLAGEAIDAQRDSAWYVLRKTFARHKLPVSLGAGLFVALVGSTIGMTSLWRKSVDAAETAQLEARDAEQVASFLENLFERSDPARFSGENLLARDLLDEGVERIDELAEQPELQARLLARMGTCYTHLGLYAESIPLLERALAIRLEHDGDEAYTTAVAQSHLGKAYYYSGFQDPEPLIRASLATQMKLHGLSEAATMDSAVALTAVLNSKGKLDEAMELCERVDAAQSEGPGWLDTRANLLANWSATHFAKRNYQEALELSQEALEIQKEIFPAPHPTHTVSLNQMAICFRNLGRLDESARAYDELIEQCVRLFGARSDRYAIFQKNRARLLEDLGRTDEAEATYREALEIFAETVSPQHTFALSCRQQLAALVYRRHRYAQALELYLEVAELFPDTPVMRSRRRAVLRTIGRCHEALGDLPAAEEALRQALEESRAATKPLDEARVMPNLADVVARRGRSDEARELYLGALETLRADPRRANDVTHCLYGLGRLRLEAGTTDEAEARLREALGHEGGDTSHWTRAAAASALGECLGRGAEAEELLLSGHDGLARELGPDHPETRDALRRLVTFYEAAGQRGKASDYRARLSQPHEEDGR